MKQKIKVAVIGCGEMGGTIVSCLLNPSAVEVMRSNGNVLRLTVCDKSEAKIARLPNECAVTLSAAQAVAENDYIILAVKPDEFPVLGGIDFADKVVISVMAAVSLDALSATLGSSKLVRAMPNLNSRVGEGFTGYVVRGISEREHDVVRELLGCLGMFREVEENDLDTVAGVSGCAVAFIYTVIKALRDEAVSRGLDSETAKAIAVQTVLGSALCAEREPDLDALIKSVCSPGGMTEAGVKYLSDNKFSEILRGAVSSSIARGEDMRV